MNEETLNLALDLAIMHHTDDGYAELRAKVRQYVLAFAIGAGMAALLVAWWSV